MAILRGRRPPLDEVGGRPDYRFSLANERTFLAWIRTALALIVAGLAVTQLLPSSSIPVGRRVVGVPLIVLGAAIAFTSYARWDASERAIRTGSGLPRSILPLALAFGIAAVAVVALVVALLGEVD